MDFDLSDDQREIRDAVRGLLAERFPATKLRAAAEGQQQDDALWDETRELGWAGIAIPAGHGGQDLGLVELAVLAEEHGAALAPTPLLPTVAAARLILRAGSAEQQARWLPGLAEGSLTAAIGLSDARGHAVLAGSHAADLLVVLGAGGEAHVRTAGAGDVRAFETIDPLRHYALATGEAGEALEGDVACGRQEAALIFAAELTGVGQRALAVTLAYVKERKQFGVPVGSFQAVSHRSADMLLDVESARSAVYYAAWSADASPALLPEAAALAKSVASDGAIDVTAAAIQSHGGVGFTWEADLHWWYKRAQLSAAILGNGKAHRRQLGELVLEQALARAR